MDRHADTVLYACAADKEKVKVGQLHILNAAASKGNRHSSHVLLTGGAAQFDVPVVFCCSSLCPVCGHVISQVRIDLCICSKNTEIPLHSVFIVLQL